MMESDLLYSKKPVVYLAGEDRRVHKSNMPAHITDQNINGRITKWGMQIDLKYLCDLGKINFPTKVDMKIRCMLEK